MPLDAIRQYVAACLIDDIGYRQLIFSPMTAGCRFRSLPPDSPPTYAMLRPACPAVYSPRHSSGGVSETISLAPMGVSPRHT